jgi:hypothetical protein
VGSAKALTSAAPNTSKKTTYFKETVRNEQY